MSIRPQLLVLDDWEGRLAGSPGVERLRQLADVTVLPGGLDECPPRLRESAEVVMAIRERTRFDAATFDLLPRLRLVLQSGGHAYHLDAEEARRRGIQVTLGRGSRFPRAAVPELTFALMIAVMRHLPEATRQMDAGAWPASTGRALAGKRLGLLGTGRHGSRVATIAQALPMEVVAWARPGSSGADTSIPRVELDELLATSDVVSVHLAVSAQTRGLLNRERLRAMKPRSVLINTSRGAIIDEDALVEVLRDGPLAGAGLDVFTTEPLPGDSPLRQLSNVALTPHIGWTVEEVLEEFADIAADQLHDYLHGVLDPAQCLPGTVPAGPKEQSRGVRGR